MKLKALVIDDSRVMRNMVIQSLQKTKLSEFDFVEAEDGADALTKFNPNEFNIAFVDWNMPNMTGVEFVRKVREKEEFEHMPMVMVTSEKTMGKIQEALDGAGADCFICKPFTVEELQVKLKKVIEKAQQMQMRRQRRQRELQQAAPSKGMFG
jgi:two-component system chemotaxis response regulator CheY